MDIRMMISEKKKAKAPTYAELSDQLCANQAAWDDEEDSVRDEHEDLIKANEQMIVRLR
jgi:hypothetical protein